MADLHHYASGTTLNVQGTGHGGNKQSFITSRGVLYITAKSPGGGIQFWKSMDNGDTWIDRGVYSGGMLTCAAEYSVFCDELDNLHVVFAKWFGTSSDGRTDKCYIQYVHGYINSNGDVAAWSAEHSITGYDYWHCPDVVAHEHNGQIRVHIFCNYSWSANNRHITCYTRMLINNQDAVNHVQETQSFLHDVTGAGTFPGKVSCELRHDGDGKTPQTVGGVRTPDILYTFTSSNVLHYGRIAYTGGNSWAQAELVVVDGVWGNIPSVSDTSTYGGLYEHHRWTKTLYSAKDSQVVIVGWMSTAGHAQQGLILYEYQIGQSSRNVSAALISWPTNANYAILSGSATLAPDGDVFLFGTNYWYSHYGYARILRRPGARTWADLTHMDTDLPTTDGARATLLQYPQGEQHVFYLRSNNVMVHWRNNRTCNYVNVTGSGLVRRPAFRKKTSGEWVPVQSKSL